jgi:hypothetical protein
MKDGRPAAGVPSTLLHSVPLHCPQPRRVLLDAVSNESSVLEGNPLSCLLFNIFIDGAIRMLDDAASSVASAAARRLA